MRTEKEILLYKTKLEEYYLKSDSLMSDLELHNANVKIERALKLYANGASRETIIKAVKETPVSKIVQFEEVEHRVQKELLKRGYVRGSKEFREKERELLMKWGETK